MSEACCGGTCEPTAAPTSAVDPSSRHAGMLPVVAAGLLIVAGGGLSWLANPAAAIACFAVSIAASIRQPGTRAVRSLRRGVLDINVLMVVAVVGAMILGEWFEAASVVWLFGIAQWMESWSLGRARRAVRQLLTLAPATASVRRGDGEEEERPVEAVRSARSSSSGLVGGFHWTGAWLPAIRPSTRVP